MNKAPFVLALVCLALSVGSLLGCGSSDSAALRPGAGRLGVKIAPTTGEIAPTTVPPSEIAPTTGEIAPTTDNSTLAISGLATAVAEIAPTTEAKLHQQPQKLHQQDVGAGEQATAIYGGQDADTTWIAVALLIFFLFLIWAVWVGRVVDRIMRRAR